MHALPLPACWPLHAVSSCLGTLWRLVINRTLLPLSARSAQPNSERRRLDSVMLKTGSGGKDALRSLQAARDAVGWSGAQAA